jgi:hypothetical protein
MNLSQTKLENAVKNKLSNGYLAMDSKNLILWGALTSLFVTTNLVTHLVSYQKAQDDCIHTQQISQAQHANHQTHIDNMRF